MVTLLVFEHPMIAKIRREGSGAMRCSSAACEVDENVGCRPCHSSANAAPPREGAHALLLPVVDESAPERTAKPDGVRGMSQDTVTIQVGHLLCRGRSRMLEHVTPACAPGGGSHGSVLA